MIIINFKKYKKGKKVVELAKICSRFKKTIVALQPKDIISVSKIKVPIYSQYINKKYDAQSIKRFGAKGTLLNHSDKPITSSTIKKRIKECRKAKLKIIVCCTNIKRAKEISKMKPDYIAIEPNELIGGKISVSTAKPSLISNTVKAVKIPVLCGAGINSKKDVSKALELGAKGVLVSSAVVKAKNPKKKIKEFLSVFRKIQ
jgi:triosephosphate isomerase